MYEYKCEILKVVDGDTFDGRVDLGFSTHRVERFRVHHIDAYEKNTKKGKEALAFAKGALEGKTLKILTTKDKGDKYGRMLATITLADGKDYAAVMIEKGYAVAYEGGKKTLPQKDA